jgi:hypothetical protein
MPHAHTSSAVRQRADWFTYQDFCTSGSCCMSQECSASTSPEETRMKRAGKLLLSPTSSISTNSVASRPLSFSTRDYMSADPCLEGCVVPFRASLSLSDQMSNSLAEVTRPTWLTPVLCGPDLGTSAPLSPIVVGGRLRCKYQDFCNKLRCCVALRPARGSGGLDALRSPLGRGVCRWRRRGGR